VPSSDGWTLTKWSEPWPLSVTWDGNRRPSLLDHATVYAYYTINQPSYLVLHAYEWTDKLFKPYSAWIRRTYFSERVIKAWNNLPADVNFNTINTFKCSINCTDFSSFLLYYLSLSNLCYLILCTYHCFHPAMHFSAKRGIAIVILILSVCLSVHPPVCLSVTFVHCD